MMLRSMLVCLVALSSTGAPAREGAAPEWVASGGASAKYPAATHLTGFGVSEGSSAAESARGAAAADLANRLSVRIETRLNDVQKTAGGKESQEIEAVTRATSDVKLNGLAFETWSEGEKVFALAVLDRAAAAAEERRQRDEAMTRAQEQLAAAKTAAKEGRESDTVKACALGQVAIAEALQHESLARVIAAKTDAPADARVSQLRSQLGDLLAAARKGAVTTMAEAVKILALDLRDQHLAGASLTAPPFTYGQTTFSSSFGRQLAMDLQAALAKAEGGGGEKAAGDVVLRGAYLEEDKVLRIVVVGSEVKTGKPVASAEVRLPRAAVPASLPFVPQNLQQALRDQRILVPGEEVSGDLRLTMWTQKGNRDLVFSENEEMTIHFRVNRPAYVRLTYLLASGERMVVAQSWYLDASKVNLSVEYPDKFEIAPPFGIEQLQAVAFTEKPEPLATVEKVIDGQKYEVVGTGTSELVKHRGVRVKKAAQQFSEATLAITTLPKASGGGP